jgi:hypothetical protein
MDFKWKSVSISILGFVNSEIDPWTLKETYSSYTVSKVTKFTRLKYHLVLEDNGLIEQFNDIFFLRLAEGPSVL